MERQEVAVNPLKTRRGGWLTIAILGRKMSYRKPGHRHLYDGEVGKWKWDIYLLLEKRCEAAHTTKLQTVHDFLPLQPNDLDSILTTLTYWLQTKVSIRLDEGVACI
jgi:hypothetical protein